MGFIVTVETSTQGLDQVLAEGEHKGWTDPVTKDYYERDGMGTVRDLTLAGHPAKENITDDESVMYAIELVPGATLHIETSGAGGEYEKQQLARALKIAKQIAAKLPKH